MIASYVLILIWDQNNFARVTLEPKNSISRLDLGKTSHKDLVFARGVFLRLVGAQNESLFKLLYLQILIRDFGAKKAL